MSVQKKGLTDDELVLAIARGAEEYAQIAKDLGLSETQVSEIAAGRLRPQLKARIDEAAQAYLANARRLGCSRASLAMSALAKLVEAEDVSAETRRRAAHDLLKYAFSEGFQNEPEGDAGGLKCGPPGLSHEQLERFAALNGGPTDRRGPAEQQGSRE